MTNSDGYPWETDDGRLQYPAVFTPTIAEQNQMDIALQLPVLPAEVIRREMMAPPPMPPRYGHGPGMPDILTCFEPAQPAPVQSIMDYTNDEAGLQSTSRPSLGQW